jgi:transcriptional regulator with XRE-family HTH domain
MIWRAWIYALASPRTFVGSARKRVGHRRSLPMRRIHRTYISDLERGVRNPTITIVERLAQTRGVEARELI